MALVYKGNGMRFHNTIENELYFFIGIKNDIANNMESKSKSNKRFVNTSLLSAGSNQKAKLEMHFYGLRSMVSSLWSLFHDEPQRKLEAIGE